MVVNRVSMLNASGSALKSIKETQTQPQLPQFRANISVVENGVKSHKPKGLKSLGLVIVAGLGTMFHTGCTIVEDTSKNWNLISTNDNTLKIIPLTTADSLKAVDSLKIADSLKVVDSLKTLDSAKVLDSLKAIRISDSTKTSDSLNIVRIADSLKAVATKKTADSLKAVRIADSTKTADSLNIVRIADSLKAVATKKTADSLKAIRIADSTRTADSLKAVETKRIADSARVADSLAALPKPPVLSPIQKEIMSRLKAMFDGLGLSSKQSLSKKALSKKSADAGVIYKQIGYTNNGEDYTYNFTLDSVKTFKAPPATVDTVFYNLKYKDNVEDRLDSTTATLVKSDSGIVAKQACSIGRKEFINNPDGSIKVNKIDPTTNDKFYYETITKNAETPNKLNVVQKDGTKFTISDVNLTTQ